MPMETVHLTDRMGTEPILSVKQFISIDTMINFDCDGNGHGDGDGTCKQAFTTREFLRILIRLDDLFLKKVPLLAPTDSSYPTDNFYLR